MPSSTHKDERFTDIINMLGDSSMACNGTEPEGVPARPSPRLHAQGAAKNFGLHRRTQKFQGGSKRRSKAAYERSGKNAMS